MPRCGSPRCWAFSATGPPRGLAARVACWALALLGLRAGSLHGWDTALFPLAVAVAGAAAAKGLWDADGSTLAAVVGGRPLMIGDTTAEKYPSAAAAAGGA